MPAIVRVDPDWQLVGEVSDRRVRRSAEHQPRVFMHLKSGAESFEEVALLLPLGAEPRERGVSKHTIQEHQSLDGPGNWNRLSVAVVPLTDRGIQRFVVHMEDPSPLLRPDRRGCREPLGQELLHEVVHLLAMGDTCERAILPANEDAGVQHDRHEEPGLTIGEAERRDRVDAMGIDWAYVPMSQ